MRLFIIGFVGLAIGLASLGAGIVSSFDCRISVEERYCDMFRQELPELPDTLFQQEIPIVLPTWKEEAEEYQRQVSSRNAWRDKNGFAPSSY